jgi:polysaccharide export outer membrane protein
MVFLREFRNILKITALLFFATFFTACRSYKNVPYFYDVPDSIYKNSSYVGVVAYTDPKIQPNDLLQVSVQTLDPSASAMSGASTTATYTVQAFSSGNSGTISGFMVDKDGMIELPLVGKIPVAGKTTSEARELIRSRAAIYYKEPSQYVVPNEKVSILDAIAMAGDLTIYGRRDNVLLIRETDGAKQFTRFNLNSTDLFQSPNFYLRQGDVVYVQPSKARVAATDMQRIRNLTIATTLINLAVILLIRLR